MTTLHAVYEPGEWSDEVGYVLPGVVVMMFGTVPVVALPLTPDEDDELARNAPGTERHEVALSLRGARWLTARLTALHW